MGAAATRTRSSPRTASVSVRWGRQQEHKSGEIVMIGIKPLYTSINLCVSKFLACYFGLCNGVFLFFPKPVFKHWFWKPLFKGCATRGASSFLSNQSASRQRLLWAPATPAWPGNVALAAMAIPSMQMEGVVTSLLEAEGTTLVRNRDLHRP